MANPFTEMFAQDEVTLDPEVTRQKTTSSEYVNNLIATEEPRHAKSSLKSLEAGGRGALNPITFGLSDELEAGAQTLQQGVTSGIKAILPESMTEGLDNTLDKDKSLSEQYRANHVKTDRYEDKLSEDHPVADFLGNLLGSAGMGLGLGKAVSGASTATRVGRLAAHSANTPISRMATQGTLGALEGGVVARNEQDNVLGGAVAGGLGGAGGQVLLGELMPWAYKGLSGKVSAAEVDQTKRYMFQKVSAALGEDTDEAGVAAMQKAAQELGPDATAADLDEVLYKKGIKLVKHSEGVENAAPLVRTIRERALANPKQFTNDMDNLLEAPRTINNFEGDYSKKFSVWSK